MSVLRWLLVVVALRGCVVCLRIERGERVVGGKLRRINIMVWSPYPTSFDGTMNTSLLSGFPPVGERPARRCQGQLAGGGDDMLPNHYYVADALGTGIRGVAVGKLHPMVPWLPPFRPALVLKDVWLLEEVAVEAEFSPTKHQPFRRK